MMNTYAQRIRRTLHQYPELGFELPKTLALISGELDAMGVPYSREYGKNSIVASINEGKGSFTIGIRADMDALPMQEENDVPYKSKHDGMMHSCGHDVHAAILLATLKELWEEKGNINCCVKFLFQPAEETGGGARSMVEAGVMKDIDCIIGLHCSNLIDTGKAIVCPFEQNANSDGFYIEFYGKSSHAGNQESGIDAIMMAVKAYTAIEFMVAKEVKATNPCLFNVGKIEGGTANNIISDHCSMFCTLRTFENEDREKVLGRIKSIINSVAGESGGEAKFIPVRQYPVVYNDERITEKLYRAAEKVVGSENIVTKHKRAMGGEDFSYFANEKPACFFKLGTGNSEKGINVGIHQMNFDIDEESLDVGVKIFKQFVYDNMNGIEL